MKYVITVETDYGDMDAVANSAVKHIVALLPAGTVAHIGVKVTTQGSRR